MCLIVRRLAITHHGHDIGKRSTGTVVFVSVEENTKTLEVICRAKNRTLCSTLLGEPQGESITVQVTVPMEFEFEFNLAPIRTIPTRHSEKKKLTSQFVAVRGTREKTHPCCDGRSEVRRMYLARCSAQYFQQDEL